MGKDDLEERIEQKDCTHRFQWISDPFFYQEDLAKNDHFSIIGYCQACMYVENRDPTLIEYDAIIAYHQKLFPNEK